MEDNDVCITQNELPENILNRISKVHFKIKKDINDLFSPVYIYVSEINNWYQFLFIDFDDYFQDLARNGTYVNGERVGLNNKRILLDNDIIALAHPRYKGY